MVFLSIDFGTSSVKAALIDERFAILQEAKAAYAYRMLPGERVELSRDDLLAALRKVVQSFDERLLQRVELICYDTFSPSLVLMEKDGGLLGQTVITHLDRRSRAFSAVVDERFGNERYMNVAGILPFAGGCSLMNILWYQHHEPEMLRKTYHLGHMTTYFHHLLTGKWMTDTVNATMLGVYDTVGMNGWSDDIIRAFDLEAAWFPQVVQPGAAWGTLTGAAASMLGLRKDIPVAAGTNDMAAAQVGAGNQAAGCILNSAGSSDMVSILTDCPAPNRHYYLRGAATKGLWQIYATTAGGFAVEWFQKQLCRDMPDDDAFHAWIAEAIRRYDGRTEVSFDPYLSGDRQSLERKTASWHGLTLASTREEMMAAMLRGIQTELRGTVALAAEHTRLSRVMKVTGGMLSKEYIEMKQRVFSEFELKAVDNCTLLGNVKLAMRREVAQ